MLFCYLYPNYYEFFDPYNVLPIERIVVSIGDRRKL